MTKRLLYKTMLMYTPSSELIDESVLVQFIWTLELISTLLFFFFILFSIGSFICTHIQTVLPNVRRINVSFNSQYAKTKRTIKFAYKHHCEAVPTYRVLTHLFWKCSDWIVSTFFRAECIVKWNVSAQQFWLRLFWVFVALVNILEIFCIFLNEWYFFRFFVFFFNDLGTKCPIWPFVRIIWWINQRMIFKFWTKNIERKRFGHNFKMSMKIKTQSNKNSQMKFFKCSLMFTKFS